MDPVNRQPLNSVQVFHAVEIVYDTKLTVGRTQVFVSQVQEFKEIIQANRGLIDLSFAKLSFNFNFIFNLVES